MARLTTPTGVTVNVSDAKAAVLKAQGYLDADKPEPSKYDGLKLDELKAEIDKRNEGRADDAKLSTAGKKADLAAALVADDES